VSAREIEARAPGIPRWTALQRLRLLERNLFVSAARETEVLHQSVWPTAPRARFALTELGRELLLEVPAAAARCEQTWCAPPLERLGPAGLWALGLVADPCTRALVWALADGPLRAVELEVRLPDLGRSALLRRLKSLPDYGVLVRGEHAGETRYALSDSTRHLAIVALRAARCEWWRATPVDSRLNGDLSGLLRVLAPLVRVPQDIGGTCRLCLYTKTAPQTDVYLTATSGRVAALNTAPMTAPQAVSHATVEVWCEALLHGSSSKIVTTGEDALFKAVFSGVSTALLA
jgi:DNA-binding HxlR family transcriptional regulator